MPSTKPSLVPRWASVSGRSAPLTAQQDTGWASGEQPSAQVMNWLQGYVGDWNAYVNDFEQHALTWSAAQTFSAGATVSSGGFTAHGGTQLYDGLSSFGASALSGGLAVTGGSGNTMTIAGSGQTTLTLRNSSDGTALRVSDGTSQFDEDITVNGTIHGTQDVPTINYVGDSGQPGFGSGASGVSGQPKLGFWIEADGHVNVEGWANAPSSSGGNIFTLPAGFRPNVPPTNRLVYCGAGVIGIVGVSSAGVVSVSPISGTASQYRIHIRFHPGQINA